MPQEFTTVTASSYDAAGLATKLTEKSADGWDVVSVVSTGTEIAAILSRAATGRAGHQLGRHRSVVELHADVRGSGGHDGRERAGRLGNHLVGGIVACGRLQRRLAAGRAAAAAADPSSGYSAASQPSTATAAPAAAAATASASSVPAGWYADPAGRFDLRYWDGGTWTEHVSRAGQQFTDPPVA